MSNPDYQQDLNDLRVESVFKAFERVRGVDTELDDAFDAQDWPRARVRLNAISQEQDGVDALLGSKDVALLHFSAPILLTLIEDL